MPRIGERTGIENMQMAASQEVAAMDFSTAGKTEIIAALIEKRNMDKTTREWLETFYEVDDLKPALVKSLEDQQDKGFLTMWDVCGPRIKERIEQLWRSYPPLQSRGWDYLKLNWDDKVYMNALAKLCIAVEKKEEAKAKSILNDSLARHTWLGTPEELAAVLGEAPQSGKKPAEDSAEELYIKLRGQVEALRGAARKKEHEGKRLVFAPDYYTQEKTRHAIGEEKAKIHAETWEELVDLADGAIRENNVTRFLAIFHKLAETQHEQELVTHMRYQKDVPASKSPDGIAHKAGEFFSYGWAGLENFRVQILVGKFKMSEQASMRHLADITDIAEKKNHHAIMRVYGTKYGKIIHKSYDEWDTEVGAEKAKMTPGTVLGLDSHLGGYEIIPALDFVSSQVEVPILQENQLRYYIANWMAIRFLLGRGQMNASQARAAAMPQNAYRILEAAGSLPNKVIELKDSSGKPQIVNQREECLKVMKDFLKFGRQQMNEKDLEKNNQALQGLFQENKIENRYRNWIQGAQIKLQGKIENSEFIFSI